MEKNLVGEKINRLLVLEKFYKRTKNNSQKRSYYKCLCDCGNIVNIRSDGLTSGKTKSCGCYKEEQNKILGRNLGKLSKKYNKYDLKSNEYGIGYFYNCDEYFMFDLEDYNKIKNFCWYKDNCGYVRAKISVDDRYKYNNNEYILLHRLLTNNYEQVDHINRNKLDDRKINLRNVSYKENARNQSIPRNNTSGIIGVYYRKERNCKWYASIHENGKQKHIGCFSSKEDAIIARLKAEKELYGKEYAPQGDLFEKYNI